MKTPSAPLTASLCIKRERQGSALDPVKGLFEKSPLTILKNFQKHFIICSCSLFDGALLPSAGPHPRLWFGERRKRKNTLSRSSNSPEGRISLSRSENITCRRHISHAAGVFHCDVACNITRGAPSPLVVWGAGERKKKRGAMPLVLRSMFFVPRSLNTPVGRDPR